MINSGNIIKDFVDILDPARKVKFVFLLLYMLFYACMEIVIIAVLSGYISLVVNQEAFNAFPIFQKLSQFLTITNQRDFLLFASVLVFVTIVVKNISKLFLEYSVARYSSNISADVGRFLTDGFLRMPYEWYMKQKLSDLILVIQWRSEVGLMIASLLNILADIILTAIMFCLFIFINNVRSLFAVCLVAGLGFLTYQFVKKRLDWNVTILRDSALKIHQSSSRTIYGFKELKIYGMEKEAVEEYHHPAKRYAKANAMKSFYLLLPVVSVETIGISFLVLYVAFVILFQGQTGSQVTNQLALLVLIVWRTLPAVNRIVNNFTKFRKVFPVVQTVHEFVQKVCPVMSAGKQGSPTVGIPLNDSMQIRNMDFYYQRSEEAALENVDFTLRKGMSVGVVGFSGAGKSTLADVLVGLLQPVSGTIDMNGTRRNLKDSFIKVDKLSYVSQTPFFFDGSIAENIAFTLNHDAIDKQLLEECCSMAAISELVDSLPQGFETAIGERGIRLSGGQLQRIAIARALYRKPDVILFDESTSSLDLKSEQLIKDTINQLMGNITLIIIAHRLETVENCDTIVWVDKGRVAGAGSADVILPQYKQALQK